jgi:hypothetical protein
MDRLLERAAVAICCLWIARLLFSGAAEPEVLTLHLFQSAIYLAVIVLVLRKSKWAFGLGISIALIWNDYTLHAGFSPVDFFAHALLMAVLALRYFRRRDKQLLDAPGFGVSFVVSVAYFAIILSLYGPQYLPKFLGLFALR